MLSGAEPPARRRPLRLLIAAPRGFCAGVERAIRIVELAIERDGAPVYVRHEIVHNPFVVDTLRAKGAVFVGELEEVPDGAPVVFSAHGVAKTVVAAAATRGLATLDATCPLVTKVHRQAERLAAAGRHILFVGHHGHPEVVGTLGQVPEGGMTLIGSVADAQAVAVRDPANVAFLTQTTLSVDDTAEIVATLRRRFPLIRAPRGEDICYATSNRQAAVKAIANQCDAMLVIGAATSSNAVRLVEVAARAGTRARLIERAAELEPDWLDGVATLGLSGGASTPECLVRELVERLGRDFALQVEEVGDPTETMSFKLPRGLEPVAA